MLRFMYALNINQTPYIHTYIYQTIHTHTHIYYLCRGVTKRIVCKSGTVADAERRTGLRMRRRGGEGGRCSHKFISCPIQALPFLDLAKCVDSLQTPTNTHTHADAHTYMNSYANKEHTYMGHCRCIARPSHAAHTQTHTRTETSLDKGVHKKSSGVSILCTHTRAHKPGLRRTM